MEADKVQTRDSSSLTSEKFLMSKKELAVIAGVSPSTIDRERKDGILVSTKVRGRVMFRQNEIDKWLKKRTRSLNVS